MLAIIGVLVIVIGIAGMLASEGLENCPSFINFKACAVATLIGIVLMAITLI